MRNGTTHDYDNGENMRKGREREALHTAHGACAAASGNAPSRRTRIGAWRGRGGVKWEFDWPQRADGLRAHHRVASLT